MSLNDWQYFSLRVDFFYSFCKGENGLTEGLLNPKGFL